MSDKPDYRIRGVCFCIDPKCDALFDGRVFHEHPNKLEQIVLPCGHKIHSILYSARCIRDGRKAEERLEKLTDNLRDDGIDPEDYLID